jgi:hypothetical protein
MPAKYPRCDPRLEHHAYRPSRRVGDYRTVNPCARHVAAHRSINLGARHIFGLRSCGQPVRPGRHVISPCAGSLLRERTGR